MIRLVLLVAAIAIFDTGFITVISIDISKKYYYGFIQFRHLITFVVWQNGNFIFSPVNAYSIKFIYFWVYCFKNIV